MTRRTLIRAGLALLGGGLAARHFGWGTANAGSDPFPVTRSEADWKRILTPAQYDVLRDHGTEPPGSSPLDGEKRPGVFHCAGCDHPLFDSAAKYDSGTGWPSFWQPLPGAVGTSTDYLLIFPRTEVHCANCGGHLGHVFDDGPPPTGKRYCMNGVAMRFAPASAAKAS
ncbi:peptide-methionine (R)-S-oxide reductase MsrB [Azospirillum sp. ST 5-10]|uniref:peptide-methionine (R)-S-oxide reductase MsrB n=1 Tax=unclassified Azospirillum TaxID=2630922 RepID=UPI003F49E5E0